MKSRIKGSFLMTLVYALAIGSMLGLIAFTEKKQTKNTCKKVFIQIDQDYGHHFINQEDISKMITLENSEKLEGTSMQEVDIKQLETRLRKHPYVQNAEIYRDIKGNIVVEVEQVRPIARIHNDSGGDQYIDETGKVLPVSNRFTARVPIITGNGKGMLKTLDFKKDTTASKFLTFLQKIDADPFWSAQIAGVEIRKNGEMVLLPQVTKQEILFGTPDNVDDKLERLMIFYKKILPLKGWNGYATVNVKYKDQIICN